MMVVLDKWDLYVMLVLHSSMIHAQTYTYAHVNTLVHVCTMHVYTGEDGKCTSAKLHDFYLYLVPFIRRAI